MAGQSLTWRKPVQIAEIEQALEIERELDGERVLDGELALHTQRGLLDGQGEIQHPQQETDHRPVAPRRSER
jgi:hypothetical protein